MRTRYVVEHEPQPLRSGMPAFMTVELAASLGLPARTIQVPAEWAVPLPNTPGEKRTGQSTGTVTFLAMRPPDDPRSLW